MSLNLNPDQMAGKSVEVGGGVWDPLGLADLGSEKTLRWFRASEVSESWLHEHEEGTCNHSELNS